MNEERKVCGKVLKGNEEFCCNQFVDENGAHAGICAFIEVQGQSAEIDLTGPITITDPMSILHFENRILRDKFVVLELNGRSYRLVLDEEEVQTPIE